MTDLLTELEALAKELQTWIDTTSPEQECEREAWRVTQAMIRKRALIAAEKARGPDPALEHVRTETITSPEIKFCHECGTPLGIVGDCLPPIPDPLLVQAREALKDAMQLVDHAHLWKTAPDEQWHMSAEELIQRYAALDAKLGAKA